jgi:predicted NUDIX family NTP pyrophosphohydrolase
VAERSAGILLHRGGGGAAPEVLLVHFGGPYWRGKQAGAWSIPKGLIGDGESAEAAARREFHEELGRAAEGPLRPLATIRQKGGKIVEAFALEGDLDAEAIESNLFTIEWPPKSGRMASFPEVDRARWFALDEARAMILPSQLPLIDSLAGILAGK